MTFSALIPSGWPSLRLTRLLHRHHTALNSSQIITASIQAVRGILQRPRKPAILDSGRLQALKNIELVLIDKDSEVALPILPVPRHLRAAKIADTALSATAKPPTYAATRTLSFTKPLR
jgi:hypothetical protein